MAFLSYLSQGNFLFSYSNLTVVDIALFYTLLLYFQYPSSALSPNQPVHLEVTVWQFKYFLLLYCIYYSWTTLKCQLPYLPRLVWCYLHQCLTQIKIQWSRLTTFGIFSIHSHAHVCTLSNTAFKSGIAIFPLKIIIWYFYFLQWSFPERWLWDRKSVV